MVTVTINLYEFNELEEQAQNEAIGNHLEVLNSFTFEDEEGGYELDYDSNEDRAIVIENIIANGYLFFKDGSLASCTTYTGKHEKADTTELKLNGEIYIVKSCHI